MDKCAGVPRHSAIKLMEFHSVNEFMRLLRSPNVKLQSDAQDIDIHDVLQKLDAKWKDWKMGISHFVQLEVEPTEKCLWYMLSRRAAGVFPIDQEAADLFIPIVTCDDDGQNAKVSLILVYVEKDGGAIVHEESVVEVSVPRWRPNSVYIPSDGGIIRVVMNFTGNWKPIEYGLEASDTQTKSNYVLGVEGIQHDPFVPEGVAEELNLLLAPWWRITELVDEDLSRRKIVRKPFVLTEEQLKHKVRCVLSKYFISECEDEEEKLTPRTSKADINVKRRKVQNKSA